MRVEQGAGLWVKQYVIRSHLLLCPFSRAMMFDLILDPLAYPGQVLGRPSVIHLGFHLQVGI